MDGLQRRKYYMAKWPMRPVFSLCPYGIVLVVFHFDSAGAKPKHLKSAANWDARSMTTGGLGKD